VHRDRFADLVCACGVYTGTAGKIARDVSLLMQFEVGEAAEPGGGSSTMPHKRNPSACAIALAAATRLPGLVATSLASMVQEHERGLGGPHAEWATIAAAVQATGAAVAAMAGAIEHLTVDPAAMRTHIDDTHGFVFAERVMMRLGPAIGRGRAHELVSRAVENARRDDVSLAAALGRMPELADLLSREDISGMDVPEDYLGVSEQLRQALLTSS
jgi:3-carboxy-cis,cis-muconate cycloisomerase